MKCFDKYGAADRKPYINKYTGDGLIDLAKYICASTCYDHHATNKVTIASVCSSISVIGSFYLLFSYFFKIIYILESFTKSTERNTLGRNPSRSAMSIIDSIRVKSNNFIFC